MWETVWTERRVGCATRTDRTTWTYLACKRLLAAR